MDAFTDAVAVPLKLLGKSLRRLLAEQAGYGLQQGDEDCSGDG
jgi:hypothetical protein